MRSAATDLVMADAATAFLAVGDGGLAAALLAVTLLCLHRQANLRAGGDMKHIDHCELLTVLPCSVIQKSNPRTERILAHAHGAPCAV